MSGDPPGRPTADLVQQIAFERERLATILRQLPSGVIITDAASRKLLLVNRRAAEILEGLVEAGQEEPRSGWTAARTFHLDGTRYTPDEWPISRSLLAGAEIRGEEMEIERHDGVRITIRVNSAPIRDAQGRIVAAVTAFDDVSAGKRVERERAEALAQEQAANRTKDLFFAAASHELRAPIDPVLGWIQLLRTKGLDAETVAHGLTTIEHNVRRLAALIDDLLDVARIAGGRLRLDLQPLRVAPVVRAAIDTMRPTAKAGGIALRVATDDTVHVAADPDRLQQVVMNLLSNAIKFTPRGGRVDVQIARQANAAEITVTDSGQGIDATDLGRVFDLFEQGTQRARPGQIGLGLGLAIARYLVELHGGTIKAASAGRGHGATFAVRLPALEAAALEGRPKKAASPTSLHGLRVLLVDDNTDGREVLRLLLAHHGADVLPAGSAAEALATLDRHAVHAVVSDIRMPDGDGLELARAIRARAGPGLPIVALTACATAGERRECLAAGFDAHVARPADPARLATLLARLVRRARQPGAPHTHTPRRGRPGAAQRR